MTTDLVMTQSGNTWDFSIAENGDLENEDFFDTSLLYSLYGEKRAAASEMPVAQYRRGWIGNVGQDFENGSKLWLFEQARLTRSTMNGIRDAALESLAWLVPTYLQEVDASVEIRGDGVWLKIILFRYNSKPETRFFELWQNTGVR